MRIYVRGSRSLHVRTDYADEGMLVLTCWRAKYGETVRIIFTSWFGTYCIYVCCFFRFDASTKKLFVSFHYHVLFFSFFMFFFCLAAVSSCKYCKHSAFMIIFRYIKIKYSWKLIISLLKYCTLHKTQFALQYIDNNIFVMATHTKNTGLFFRFAGTEKC